MGIRGRQLSRVLCAVLSLPWFVVQSALADVSVPVTSSATTACPTSTSTTTTCTHHHPLNGTVAGVAAAPVASHGPSPMTAGLTALPQGTSLDLSSTHAVIAAPNASALSIQVGGTLGAHGISGGSTMTVNPGQMLTAAEYLAVTQAMHGTQHLLLTTQGVADGGSALLGANTITSALSSLVIPAHVTLTSVGFGKQDPLTVSGLTTVGGTLNAVQWQPNTPSFLNFGSLDVLSGGLITSTATAASHLFSSSALNLTVANSLINHGTISSPGALNILANGGTIANNGLISAHGAVNLSSIAPALNIAGTGTIQSVVDAINVNAATLGNNLNINFAGNNFLSNALNITAGTSGIVSGALANVTGVLNETAGISHLTTQGNALTLGNINILGDPTYYNSSGAVTISSAINIGAGANLAIAAATDINFTGAGSVSTAGGSVLLVSGANITPAGVGTAAAPIAINGASSATGGAISIGATSPITTNGGNVTMVAMGSNGSITDSSAVTSGGGNLTAIANSGITFGGAINTSGGSGTGNVSLSSATPTQSGAVSIDVNGTATGTFSAGTTQAGNIQFGTVTTPSGATLTAVTNGTITDSAAALNLGATNYSLNAGSSPVTFQATGGSGITMGSGTITSTGTGQVSFNAAAGPIDFTAAAAGNANVVNANAPVVFNGSSIKFGSPGTLTFTTSGTADGALQAGAVFKAASGIAMPGGGGTLTLNFNGSGGALYDNGAGANFTGINATNLVVNNTGGDTHIFAAGNMDNTGGTMSFSVPSSGGYYQTELQLMGTGLNHLSNITSSGGPLNMSSPGKFELSGSITNNFPQQPLAGGITVSSGYTCAGCPNTQTGIIVDPNAQILAQGGYIMLTVSNTQTSPPVSSATPLISIGSGAVVHSYGWITGGFLSGGGVQVSVNNSPPGGLYGLLTGNRGTTYTYPGYGTIQQIDSGTKQTTVPLVTAPMTGGGKYQADSEGIVAIDNSGVHGPDLIQGTGFVNGTGGVVYVGGASYAGEIVINGSVIGSFPVNGPPPVVGGIFLPPAATATTTSTPAIAGGAVSPFNPPGLSQLPQTDTTRSSVMIAASLNQPAPVPVNLSSQSASSFIAGTCQKFLIGDDRETDEKKTFAVALTASTLAVDSVPQNANANPMLDLQRGRLLVITGDHGLDVHTMQATFVIPAHSASIVEQDEDGQASAVAISGADITANLTGPASAVNSVKIPVGQWLLASAQGGQVIARATYETLGITKLADSLRNVELRKVNLATVLACDHVSVCVMDNGKKDLDRMLKQKLDQIQQSFKASAPSGPVSIINGNRLAIKSDIDSELPPTDPHLVPVAFGAPPAVVNAHFSTLRMPTATAKAYGNASLTSDSKGNLLLGQGEVLLQCNAKTILVAGKNTATIEPGTTVLAKYERGVLFVSDLWERTDKAINLISPTRTIRIGVSEQAISGYSNDILDALIGDATGRRRMRELVSNTAGGGIAWCDVSIQSLMQFDPLLRSIRTSKYSDDQNLTERFIKMAAVINTVDYNRGVYSTFQK